MKFKLIKLSVFFKQKKMKAKIHILATDRLKYINIIRMLFKWFEVKI